MEEKDVYYAINHTTINIRCLEEDVLITFMKN